MAGPFSTEHELASWLVRRGAAGTRSGSVLRGALTGTLRTLAQAAHGVPAHEYGQGQAKSVADLLTEVRPGREVAYALAGGRPTPCQLPGARPAPAVATERPFVPV